MPQKKEPASPERLDLPDRHAARPGTTGPAPTVGTPFFNEINKILKGQDELSRSQFQSLRRQRIRAIEDERESSVVVYYAVSQLDGTDAKLLYNMLSSLREKPTRLDLFIVSPGGFIDPAYKMALMCRESCAEKFSVLVPYYAKSAATLLALGADEIVMGPTSELGPIDPQVRIANRSRSIPALSLRDAIRFVQDTLRDNPEQAMLFARLLEGMDIRTLGEYERVIAGSEQYARELLKRMCDGDEEKAGQIAKDLVTEYKIHGFVIDSRRARDGLGLRISTPSERLWENMWQLVELYETLIRESRTADGMICKVFEGAEQGPYPLWRPIKKGEDAEQSGRRRV
jgi:DNA-binding protein Fis